MKFPTWFRYFWLLMLLVVTSYTLFRRYDAIIFGQTTLFDVFVFLIWAALMLTPNFSEINFFGLKLKQSIEDLKEEVSEIRTEISNRINVNPIFNLTPSSDPIIQALGKKILEQTQNVKAQTDFDVPELNNFLFKVRYKIEHELRRIWDFSNGESRVHYQFGIVTKIMRELFERGILSPEIYGGLKEVIAICNYGIHTEKVTDKQINFVKDVSPRLIASLENLNL